MVRASFLDWFADKADPTVSGMETNLEQHDVTAQALIRARRYRELPAPHMQRALRVSAGIPAAEVARLLGVSRQAVSMWERGHSKPSQQHLDAYLAVLAEFRREEGERA